MVLGKVEPRSWDWCVEDFLGWANQWERKKRNNGERCRVKGCWDVNGLRGSIDPSRDLLRLRVRWLKEPCITRLLALFLGWNARIYFRGFRASSLQKNLRGSTNSDFRQRNVDSSRRWQQAGLCRTAFISLEPFCLMSESKEEQSSGLSSFKCGKSVGFCNQNLLEH